MRTRRGEFVDVGLAISEKAKSAGLCGWEQERKIPPGKTEQVL